MSKEYVVLSFSKVIKQFSGSLMFPVASVGLSEFQLIDYELLSLSLVCLGGSAGLKESQLLRSPRVLESPRQNSFREPVSQGMYQQVLGLSMELGSYVD